MFINMKILLCRFSFAPCSLRSAEASVAALSMCHAENKMQIPRRELTKFPVAVASHRPPAGGGQSERATRVGAHMFDPFPLRIDCKL